MSTTNPDRYDLKQYTDPAKAPPIFRLVAQPDFAPIDFNIAFLAKNGWSQAVDRLRFHYDRSAGAQSDHPLAQAIGSIAPHILVRKLDLEADRIALVQIFVNGEVEILSNDKTFAHKFLAGLLLECPPSFHSADELKVHEDWLNDSGAKAVFAGILAGGLGWDPAHGIPDNIQESLDEARNSFEIENYRSSVVMSRRTLEAVLKFGYPRLLGKPAVDKNGRSVMLDAMIKDFRNAAGTPIPMHLLHIADSLRLIGNVPGAHAAEIKGYQFSRSDAEFALIAIHHFLDLYFSKIDAEVDKYYTVTIDLSPPSKDES